MFTNNEIAFIPAYTNREVRNFGLYTTNSLYKYMFTREDNILIETGAISLFPLSMFKFYTCKPVNLNGIMYEANAEINAKDFDENTLKVLIKTKVLALDFIEDLKTLTTEELIKQAKVYTCEGLTFKQLAETLNIDFSIIKEKFELKQGGNKKKVTSQDIIKLKEFALV